MVDPSNGWDAYGEAGDEEFENLLNIFDFPLENFEGDGFGGDWDNSQCIEGPIPSNESMGSNAIPNAKPSFGSPCFVTKSDAHIDEFSDDKKKAMVRNGQAPDPSKVENKFVDIHDLGTFGTQSPISVLECSGSSSSGKSLLTKLQNTNPVRTRSKRRRPALNPRILTVPWFTSCSNSRKTPKDRRKKSELENISPRNSIVKKCTHCEVTKTPQWREGPLGPKTLCNACGVRYRSGRLLPEYRPAASPTFVPSLHSNSHKKVIEMRSKSTNQMATDSDEAPVSPQPEFVPISSYLFDNQLLPFG